MGRARPWRRFVPFPRRETLRRWMPPFADRNIAHLIARARADLVVDAGANRGGYVARLLAAGCPGPFLSIEPQAEAHAALRARAEAHPGWRVAPRLALGAEAGEITLHRYADDSLASTLRPAAKHAPAAAFADRGAERVPLAPLDRVMAEHAPESRRPFLKLDLQGGEKAALAGAPETLARAAGIQIELPLLPGYEGEAGWLELLAALDALGFAPVYFAPVTARTRLGPWHQTDAVLLRPEDI